MLTGSCLCGAIRYAIEGRIGPVVNCHCSQCRKASGAAFASNASVRRDAFRFLAGRSSVREYESSPGKFRAFCGQCGSPVYSRRDSEPELRRIRLGTLDSDPERRPLAHVWTGSKAPWYEIRDGLPQYPGDPPGFGGAGPGEGTS